MEDNKERSRGIYILPNLFTTGTLFAGFYAIIASINDRFEAAAVAIFIAMIMDGLDGRIARMTNTQSEFGAQYDSMSDVVAFGLAPALVMYEWSLSFWKMDGWFWAKLGWVAAFVYAVCAALRLARFNTNIGKIDKKFFQGLASPAAAAVMAGFVWVANDWGYAGSDVTWLAFFLTLASGLLMVSNLNYLSFKDIDLSRKVSFFALLATVMVLVMLSIDPATMLFVVASVYAVSGPLLWLKRMRDSRKEKREENGAEPPLDGEAN